MITRQIQADSSTGIQVKTSAGVVQASFDKDGSLMIMDPATNETYFQIGPTLAGGGNLIKSDTTFVNPVSTQSLVTHGLLEPKAGINMHSQNIINAQDMTGRHVSTAGGYYSGSVKKNLCFSVEGVDPVTGAASRLWYVDSQGHMSGEGEFHAMSSATGDNSNYIGSSRFSYDRTNHVVTLHRLKTDHVPAYLAGRGITTGDLSDPINNMTIVDWVNFAKSHLDEDLTISQIFPHTTTGDWVQIDAPVPTLQAWANGADADITTLENEMDAAEVRLDALEAVGPASADPMGIVHVDAAYGWVPSQTVRFSCYCDDCKVDGGRHYALHV